MPVFPSTAVLEVLSKRNATDDPTNTTSPVLHVICAFPVSGQYGFGSRLLYYILLIIACLAGRKDGRKNQLLRHISLAAALIIPAVAAIHAIILAALHNDASVDMDIFGVFQLCSIGILAAPVTVKRSKFYWGAQGRSLIFPWTIIILIGLLSLTVEFCRTKTTPCPYDDSGQPTSIDPQIFNYNNPPSCSMTCSVTQGPFSLIRQGSANNIYLVPSPERITFGMGALFSAGCCIPAVLNLAYIWVKILKINWSRRRGIDARDEDDQPNAKMAKKIWDYLIMSEAFLFFAFAACILVVGEANFFSVQVRWQSEPMSAVGQWATIVGPFFAAVGAIYVRGLKKELKEEEKPDASDSRDDSSVLQKHRDKSPASSKNVVNSYTIDESHSLSNGGGGTLTEPAITRPPKSVSGGSTMGEPASPAGGPKPTATWNHTADPADKQFDDTLWRSQEGANDYPNVHGEKWINADFHDIIARYNPGSGAGGSATPLRRQTLRPGSFTSVNPGNEIALRDTSTSREPSPRRQMLSDGGTSPEQLQTRPRRDTLDIPHLPSSRRPSVSSRTSGGL